MIQDVNMSEERVVTNMAKMVYILYLVSLVFGITSVVAVVIAYVNRNDDGHAFENDKRAT